MAQMVIIPALDVLQYENFSCKNFCVPLAYISFGGSSVSTPWNG